jgi:hypothetical protein
MARAGQSIMTGYVEIVNGATAALSTDSVSQIHSSRAGHAMEQQFVRFILTLYSHRCPYFRWKFPWPLWTWKLP